MTSVQGYLSGRPQQQQQLQASGPMMHAQTGVYDNEMVNKWASGMAQPSRCKEDACLQTSLVLLISPAGCMVGALAFHNKVLLSSGKRMRGRSQDRGS